MEVAVGIDLASTMSGASTVLAGAGPRPVLDQVDMSDGSSSLKDARLPSAVAFAPDSLEIAVGHEALTAVSLGP